MRWIRASYGHTTVPGRAGDGQNIARRATKTGGADVGEKGCAVGPPVSARIVTGGIAGPAGSEIPRCGPVTSGLGPDRDRTSRLGNLNGFVWPHLGRAGGHVFHQATLLWTRMH